MDNEIVLNDAISRVKAALQAKGLTCEIKQFAESTRTANEAAAVIGCEVAQIIKSLLFRTIDTKKAILILVSGKNRVNEQAIEVLIGEKIIKADADFTKEVTGFSIGGIPPLANEKINLTFIDQDLLGFQTLWAAAGSPFAVFSLKALDIEKITQGKVVSIK